MPFYESVKKALEVFFNVQIIFEKARAKGLTCSEGLHANIFFELM